MITNINEFINSMNFKGLNNRGSIYAQIIKGERLKQNKTLEEVASGICSISYLCKLENYMIYPPQPLVKAVFEKMNLTYSDINEENLENVLDNSLEYFFNKDKNRINNEYLLVKEYSSSPQVILVKTLYNLLEKKYEDVANDVAYLDNIKDTLGGLEALALLLITITYYIENNNYKRASFYLTCLDYLKIDNKYIKYLIYEANLVTSFHLKENGRFVQFYNRINDDEFIGYPMSKRICARLMYDIIKYSDYPIDAYNDCNSIDLRFLNDFQNKNILYYKYLIMINCHKYIDVFKEIVDSKNYLDIRFLGVLAICGYFINQKEYYDYLVEIVNECNEQLLEKNNLYHKSIIYLVLMNGLDSNKEEIREYYKTEILPFVDKTFNYLYDDVVNKIYVNLLASLHQYKDAYNYLLMYGSKTNKNI